MASHNTALSASSLPPFSNPSTSKHDKAEAQDVLEGEKPANATSIIPNEDSIARDENYTYFSAGPILPVVPFNLQGKDVSQVTVHRRDAAQPRPTSLPSSPTRSSHCRGIARLRDEILRMKESAYSSCKGQFYPPAPSPLPITEPSSPSFTNSPPLEKGHGKLPSPSKHTPNTQHQARTSPSANFKKALPPQQPYMTKTKTAEFIQSPMVNNQPNLPLENPITSSAHNVDLFNSTFPPL